MKTLLFIMACMLMPAIAMSETIDGGMAFEPVIIHQVKVKKPVLIRARRHRVHKYNNRKVIRHESVSYNCTWR